MLQDRPLCKCHGEPMYPNNNETGWRCRVKVRKRQNAVERTLETQVKRRRRELRQQRDRILEQLTNLRRETS